jgi:NAD(P)H-hydrate epimerase
MKLFNREQLRMWDQTTIERHYSSSVELMEVAAHSCAEVLVDKAPAVRYIFFCGIGNNGGDGLVMARLLHEQQLDVLVVVVGDSSNGSNDFRANLQILMDGDLPLSFMSAMPDSFELSPDAVIVDALFGSGLNRPIEGWLVDLIVAINALPNRVVAIDIPSGLQADLLEAQSGPIVEADITLTIETPKRSMFFAENDRFVGKMVIVPLGLDADFEDEQACDWIMIDDREVSPLLRDRMKYSHKGMHGHLQVNAGSAGMMGACMLVSYAAMRTGTGKVTACVAENGVQVLQTALPEVICKAGFGLVELERFEKVEHSTALVIGPGIGTGDAPSSMIDAWLKSTFSPAIIDADALTIIAREGWMNRIPAHSIITPHVGEFDRMFGKHESHFARLHTQMVKSQELGIIIVLKGAHTRISTPDGLLYINSTGNPGMATAGSGDVLSGIIGGLLAQGYVPLHAALLGVYMHGLAGDVAAEARGMDSIIARDIIEFIGDAYTHLRGINNPEG